MTKSRKDPEGFYRTLIWIPIMCSVTSSGVRYNRTSSARELITSKSYQCTKLDVLLDILDSKGTTKIHPPFLNFIEAETSGTPIVECVLKTRSSNVNIFLSLMMFIVQ